MNAASPPTVYLYSEECAASGLPVACEVVRVLRVGDMASKGAVLALASPAYREAYTQLAVVAKGTQTMLNVFDGQTVGVYVMPMDGRVGEASIDLSAGLQPVLDWGALTTDAAEARRAQEQLREA